MNYSLDTTEVLLNLAACLLSKPFGIELLSFSSRVRDALGGDADSTNMRKQEPRSSLKRSVALKVKAIASNRDHCVMLRQSHYGLDDADPNDLSVLPS